MTEETLKLIPKVEQYIEYMLNLILKLPNSSRKSISIKEFEVLPVKGKNESVKSVLVQNGGIYGLYEG